MEWKIGEIFEFGGEWYQVIDNTDGIMCSGCVFVNEYNECAIKGALLCGCGERNDEKSVIFKKLEKVGEPYSDYCPIGRVVYFQRYKCYQNLYIRGI